MSTNTVDPKSVQMCSGAVVINDVNVNSGIILREKKLLNNPNLWHKVVVQCCDNLPRDVILKAILDDVHPLDFIPVFFSVEGVNASFFARNCRQAIEKLCRQNLVIANPQNKDKPFKLMIILAFTNTNELIVNVQDNINTVLTKRYQSNSKMLNLDSFYKDPDLTEFSTLSQPKILYFVLHLSKQFPTMTLKLTNNDIRILSPVESIWGLKSLLSLDLRNNLIEKMSELNILKSMHITDLFLDGNPVCDAYDEYSYVQAVREVCPKIEKLDGVILGQKGFLPFRRNYVCNREAQELVDQFLEHYFTLYDKKTRTVLDGLYSKDALFSMTCRYLPGQTSSSSTKLTLYKRKSRNLKMLSDLSKSNECLITGGANIIRTLESLPKTEHDPYSFTIDLVLYTDKICVLIVTGVFREVALLESEQVYGFTRTFVLKASPDTTEYNIINDQLHISNATTAQQQRAFKVSRVSRQVDFKMEPAKTPAEKNDMLDAFKAITTLNKYWAKKCLEDCSYDFPKALAMFVDSHKKNHIPEEAFIPV